MEPYEFTDTGEMNCFTCGKRFSHYRDVIYSTEKIEPENKD